jgi:hypothetical protein
LIAISNLNSLRRVHNQISDKAIAPFRPPRSNQFFHSLIEFGFRIAYHVMPPLGAPAGSVSFLKPI